jgi:hypothetical protein
METEQARPRAIWFIVRVAHPRFVALISGTSGQGTVVAVSIPLPRREDLDAEGIDR